MNYGYQEIQRVMSEASVSFEQADRALKKARGDVKEAVIIALRRKQGANGIFERAIDAFVRLFFYRIRIEKKDKVYFDIALWIVGCIILLAEMALSRGTTLFLYFVTFMIVLFSGSKLTFEVRKAGEVEPELVDAKPMQEDEVLQNYPDDNVAEEGGYHSVEV